MRPTAVCTGFAVLVALTTAGVAIARPALLPSPTVPLDARVPLTAAAPAGPTQLPRNARAANRQEVLVEVRNDGTVVRLRVRQRLTLTGLGDFFFQISAPVRDVRALADSQGEPGLRQNAILWQGFSPGRRVLAAEAELEPKAAAAALPLRIKLNETRLVLRNTTAVRGLGFTAAVRPSAVRTVLTRIADEARVARPTPHVVEVEGPTTGRRLLVDAPLRVRGVIRAGRRVARRFELVLGGPAPREATIPVGNPGDGRAEVELSAEPIAAVPELRRPPLDATGTELLLLAERSLLRLARVHQYRTFLSGPASGPARSTYRFRTVATRPPAPTEEGDDSSSLAFVVLLGAGAVLVSAGAIVVWAHL